MSRLEVVADKVIDLLLARIRCTHAGHMLAKRLVVGWVLAVLRADLTPLIVLLPNTGILR